MNSTADLIERLKWLRDGYEMDDPEAIDEAITALSPVMPDTTGTADLIERLKKDLAIADADKQPILHFDSGEVREIITALSPVMPDEVAKRCDYLRELAREFAKEANQKLTPEAVAEGVNRIPESTTVWKAADLLERQQGTIKAWIGSYKNQSNIIGEMDFELQELQQRIEELKLEVKTLAAKEALANGEIDLRGKRIEELTRENQINEANKNRRAYIVEVESQRDQLAEALERVRDYKGPNIGAKSRQEIAEKALKRIMEKK